MDFADVEHHERDSTAKETSKFEEWLSCVQAGEEEGT